MMRKKFEEELVGRGRVEKEGDGERRGEGWGEGLIADVS